MAKEGSAGADVDWERRWPPPRYWVKVGLVLIGVVIGVYLLGVVRGVLLIIVAAFVIAIGFQPAIKWLERRGLSRGIGLAVLLMSILFVIGGMTALALPLVISQVGEMLDQLPGFIGKLQAEGGLAGRLAGVVDLDRLEAESIAGPTTTLQLAGNALGFVFNFVTLVVVTPYLALSMPSIKVWLVRLLRPHHREDFLHLSDESTDLMANYIVGNLVMSLVAGVVTWVGLMIIGVPYALALAAWVAITDLIPIVGAVLGGAGVAAVAFFEGPEVLIWSLVLVVVYQQVENFLIAPRVMKRAVDLNPAVVIIAVMVGGTLAGLIGALLALPIAALIKIVLKDYVLEERMRGVRAEVMQAGGLQASRTGRRRRPLP